MSWDTPSSRQEFDEIWYKWLDNIKQGVELTFVLRNSVNNEFLGIAALHQMQTEIPELGIWIREDRHGLGFGKETIQSIVDWASIHLKIKQFIYPVTIENYASRKIVESLGGILYSYEKKPKYDAATYLIPTII